MPIRYYLTSLLIVTACWLQSYAAPGDTTTIGPTFSFGNLSTNNLKVKATRPTDTIRFQGINNTITASGKVITITGAVSAADIALKLDKTTFNTYTSADRLTPAAAAITYVPYSSATKDVKLGSKNLEVNNMHVTGTGGNGWLLLHSQSVNPPAPPTNALILHSSTANGFTRMEQDNEAATNLIYGRDEVFIAKNTSGSTITKGQPVYITGSTGNVPNVGLARANSLTTLTAIGLALDNIGDNNFGQIMKHGIISSINTSAYSTGDSLWVSTSSAGALQNTRPTYPNFVQRMASVLVSGVGNGSLLVVTAPFVGGMESGTSNNFTAAGTLAAVTGGSLNRTVCWKAGGVLGYCSTIVAADGSCTCN